MRELPKYKCHKVVWALKIAGIEQKVDGSTLIVPDETGYGPLEVSRDFMSKHKPQVGGYYVVYKDGYASYSPADAFEDGYTKIS